MIKFEIDDEVDVTNLGKGRVFKVGSGKSAGHYYVRLENGLEQLCRPKTLTKINAPNVSTKTSVNKPKQASCKKSPTVQVVKSGVSPDFGMDWWKTEAQ